MPPTAIIVCSTERLYAYDDANTFACGFNVTVSSDDPSATEPKLFRPWTWDGFYQVRLFVDDGGNGSFFDQNIQQLTWHNTAVNKKRVEPGYKALIEQLETIAVGADFSLAAKATGEPQPVLLNVTSAPQLKWSAFLADLSLRPAPLPHVLNLSFFLRIPKIANARLVALAPILPANVVKNQDIPPQKPFALTLAGKNVVDWPYDFAHYSILARTQIIDLTGTPPASSEFLDLQRLMVKPGTAPSAGKTSGSNFYDDWRAALESKLSSSLDYSTLLQDAISELDPKNGALNKYVELAIAATRDTVGIGLYPRPDGGRLLDEFLKTPDWKQIEQAASTAFGNSKTWSNILKSALPVDLHSLQIWDPPVGFTAADAAVQLNRLHSALHEPENLRKVLLAQWRELAKTAPAFKGLEIREDIDIRRELLLENLGWHWDRIRSALGKKTGTGSSPDTKTSRENLSSYASTILTTRFSPGSGRYPSLDASALLDPLKKRIDVWAGQLALNAIPDSDNGAAKTPSDQQSLTGYGLTFQIDALRDSAQSTQDDKDDQLRKIRGGGLLLRRDKGQWRCVNLASVQTHKGNTPVEVEDTVLIPNRIVYQNGLNLATISYNNDPLSAQGPLSFATDVQLHPGDSSSSGDRLLAYFYSIDQVAKLAGLVFGSSYDALPFLVSNCGVLPPRIASATSPIELSSSLPADLAVTYKNYLRANVQYPRFAPVAPPRLFDQFGKQELSFPRIPTNVFPRSRETEKGTQPEVPLLLLAPKAEPFAGVSDRFTFSARPPATDIHTWDRFVNGTSRGTQSIREQVWCSYYDLETKNRFGQSNLGTPGTVAGPKIDNSIDDPAAEFDSGAGIDRRFYVRMEDENGTETCACFLKIPQTDNDGIAIVQAPPVHISVVIGPTAQISGKEGIVSQVSPNTTLSGDIVLTVPDASVCSFELCSCVHKNHTSRFSSFRGVQITGTNFYRTSSQRVLVEVADSQFPTSTELWNAFSLDDSTAMLGAVSLNLKGDAKVFKNVWRAQILRQVWKWSGRPVTPPLPPPDKDPKRTEWEVRQFGSRYDFDHIVMPMLRNTPFSFSYTERMQGPGSSDDLKATYLRFGLRAYSRYAGILASGYTAEARPDPESRAWIPCYIPCRKFVDIKPLDVKLILPLTRKASDEQLPGLMVLLRGPWFQEGGLGELIEAEVQIASDPDYPDGAAPTKFYYQYGPDPVLTSSAAGVSLEVGRDEVQFRQLTGPVGHTFDIGSDDPLFVNTSFLLSPPDIQRLNQQKKVKEASPNDPWSFCKIRLKRVIHLDREGGRKTVESQFTQPFWVQYLPDFSIFGGIDVSELFLKMTDGIHLQLRDNAGPKQLSTQAFFSLFVVLTRRVTDATGSEGQEEFVALFQKTDEFNWVMVGTQPVPDYQTSEFRARVIEVQPGSSSKTLQKLANADTLWEAMFRPDMEDSARARITRVSSPVDTVSNMAANEVLECFSAVANS